MRLAHSRSGTRLSWLIAALTTLSMAGCGGSEEPGASTAGTSASAGGAGSDRPPGLRAEPAGGGDVVIVPPGSVVAEPLGNEQGVDGPMTASFPAATQPGAPRPTLDGLPADDPILGQPLVINGTLIPFDEVRKAVCLGGFGAGHIETAKVKVFIEHEIERLKAAGASSEQLVVSDDELDAVLGDLAEEVRAEYPEGEVSLEDVLAGMGTNQPKESMRVMRLFHKVFLPDDPERLPPRTLEALLAAPGGDMILEEYRTGWKDRQGDAASTKKTLAERQFDDAILESIHGHLMRTAVIERDPTPGALYRVDGTDITVDQVWEAIKFRVTTAEVREAKQWIVNYQLLKKAFIEAGAWLNDEEAEAAYALHSDPYKDSIFSQERIALAIKEFPSIERYRDYRRLYDSLHKMRKPMLTEAEFEKQAQFRTNKVVGQVSVDVDILLAASFDMKTFRWKEDGWLHAENKMRDVINLLVEEQRPWNELMENYSDFYSRPVPMSQRDLGPQNSGVKGRFRNFQRNNLLAELGESEYSLFLNGESIADFIFFEQEVGTLGDPMRGPLGWYMPRLLRRNKAPTKVPINPDSMKALVLDDYLSWHVAKFAQEQIGKNEVYGLQDPGTRPKLPQQPGAGESASEPK